MGWVFEASPYKIRDDARALEIVLNHQRFGKTFEVYKDGAKILWFYGYSEMQARDTADESFRGADDKETVIWNICTYSGSMPIEEQRPAIVEFFEAFQCWWGEGTGRAHQKADVNVRVVFDAPTPG